VAQLLALAPQVVESSPLALVSEKALALELELAPD